MPFDPRQYMKLMFYTICAVLICTYVFAGEKYYIVKLNLYHLKKLMVSIVL